MVILFSEDGASYSPRQYYARDCSQFGLIANTILSSSTGVNCLSPSILQYPFIDQYLVYQLLGSSYRPNTDSILQYNLQLALQQFSRASHVRLQLFGWHPEQAIEQRYFAIDNVVMLGRECVCNGHASSCEDSVCVCQHNTMGNHCDQCRVLYNNSPWQPGTVNHANECTMCQCNNHSLQCYYDDQVGGGVCINCTDSTHGQQCQQCLPLHYHSPSLPISSPLSCQPCHCSAAGITDEGDCRRGDGPAGSDTGQCSCKPLATGRDCSVCPPEYYNLSSANPNGCQPCSCNTSGTVEASNSCDDVTGQCSCLPNVIGQTCSQCAANHYGPGAAGCLACHEQCVECTGPADTNCKVTIATTVQSINFCVSPLLHTQCHHLFTVSSLSLSITDLPPCPINRWRDLCLTVCSIRVC